MCGRQISIMQSLKTLFVVVCLMTMNVAAWAIAPQDGFVSFIGAAENCFLIDGRLMRQPIDAAIDVLYIARGPLLQPVDFCLKSNAMLKRERTLLSGVKIGFPGKGIRTSMSQWLDDFFEPFCFREVVPDLAAP